MIVWFSFDSSLDQKDSNKTLVFQSLHGIRYENSLVVYFPMNIFVDFSSVLHVAFWPFTYGVIQPWAVISEAIAAPFIKSGYLLWLVSQGLLSVVNDLIISTSTLNVNDPSTSFSTGLICN